MKHFQVPSVEELLEKDYPHYPYHKKFGQSRMEPLVMLYVHSYHVVNSSLNTS